MDDEFFSVYICFVVDVFAAAAGFALPGHQTTYYIIYRSVLLLLLLHSWSVFSSFFMRVDVEKSTSYFILLRARVVHVVHVVHVVVVVVYIPRSIANNNNVYHTHNLIRVRVLYYIV